MTYFWLSLTHTVQGALLLASLPPHFPIKKKCNTFHKSGLQLKDSGVITSKNQFSQKKANPSGAQLKDGDFILFIM